MTNDRLGGSTPRLLIVGCGYVGGEVARRAVADGKEVFALTRSSSRCDILRGFGITPILGHWLAPDLPTLPSVDRVLVAIPHRDDESGFGTQAHTRGLQNLLAHLPVSADRRLVYLSTTGVYGAHNDDSRVDENSLADPQRPGGQMALIAEHWLREHLRHPQLTILRLAGIYGPGRVPLAAKLRRGEALAVPRDGYLNLVHLVDIARMIDVVFGREMRDACYVFSDGHPVPRLEFYKYLAELCGVAEPEFVAPEDDSRARRSGYKRIDPSRIVCETQFDSEYPDYRSGLASALQP